MLLLKVYQVNLRVIVVFEVRRFIQNCKLNKALIFLKEKVSLDENWRAQEILAKAFDTYCHVIGYENALPTIKEWLNDSNPKIRRAVTEGLRIWTNRDYFIHNPIEE
jgi:hypothetical protein